MAAKKITNVSRKACLLLAGGAVVGLAALRASAASTWTGASDNNWSRSSNWDPSDVPGDIAGEDAVVNSGTPTIDDNFTLRDFTFGGGTLHGTAGASLSVLGTFGWTGGTIASDAFVSAGGTMSFGGSTLTNHGTLSLSTETISVAGSNTLNNTGTLLVDGGTLELRGGASSGRIHIGSGGTIEVIGSGYSFAPGASFSGSGTLAVISTATLGSTLSVTNLNLSGTISGGTLTTTGQFNWTGGNMSGGGQTTVAPSSTMLVSGTVSLASRSLINNGTIHWSGDGNFNIHSGAVLTNGGLLSAAGNGAIVAPAGLGTGLLVNTGTVSKSTGTGVTSIQVPFDNDGTVIVSSGTLSLSGGGTGASTSRWIVAPGATLRFAGGAASPYVLDSGAAITNSGALINAGYLRVTAGQLAGNGLVMDPVTGQELYIDGTVPVGSFVWNRGVISGAGTSTLAGKTITDRWAVAGGRVLENSGVIDWDAGLWGLGFTDVISAFDNTTPGVIRNGGGGRVNVNFSASLGLPGLPGALIVDNTGTFAVASARSVSVHGEFNNGGTVELGAGAALRLAYGGVSSGTFSLGSGATLVLDGPVTHTFEASSRIGGSGDVTFDGDLIEFHGGLNTSGAVRVGASSPDARLNIRDGASIAASDLIVQAGSVIIDGAVAASSGIDLVGGTTIARSGASTGTPRTTVVSGATLRIEAGATFATGDYTHDGLLHLDGGTLAVTGAAELNSGRVVGTGTLAGNVNAGLVDLAPGDPAVAGDASTIHVTGPLTLGDSTALILEINASGPGHTNDRVTVGGAVELGGAFLLLSMVGSPSSLTGSETFTIVTSAGAVSGTLAPDSGIFGPGWVDVYDANFNVVVGAFQIEYQSNSVVLGGFAVPEPASVAVGLMSLLLLGRRRRIARTAARVGRLSKWHPDPRKKGD